MIKISSAFATRMIEQLEEVLATHSYESLEEQAFEDSMYKALNEALKETKKNKIPFMILIEVSP